MATDEPQDENRLEASVNNPPPKEYLVGAAAHSPRTDWQPGHKLDNGRYEVDGLIGVGGMGKVYLAHSVANPEYRFAVKRTKRLDDFSRRAFLAELQSWIDLPRHPHIVGCRFFRTENDEVIIFAEYVDGGSLDAWIRNNPNRTVEQILDYASQFAWGLHQAHELGLVHQDVKPGNALITKDGLVKVCDFGLSRARYFSGEENGEGSDPRHSNHGCTLLYRSPEQARGETLTKQTDIWSWGVAVLEMLTGQPRWDRGEEAAIALESHLESSAMNGSLMPPKQIAELLRKCFRKEPQELWSTLFDAAQMLTSLCQELTTKTYTRSAPHFVCNAERTRGAEDRRTAYGVEWSPAVVVLAKALEADGRDLSEAARYLELTGTTRKGQGAGELAGYDEAKRVYEALIVKGRNELREELAGLCLEKALLHLHLEDINGAVAQYDRAIAIRERLVEEEGRSELGNDLALVYVNRAILWRGRGESVKARQDAERAIEIVNAPENRSTAAVREKIVETARRIKGDAAAPGMSTMNPAAMPDNYRPYIPRPQLDANEAARRNIEYRKALAVWQSLPFLKRWKTPKPEPPSDA